MAKKTPTIKQRKAAQLLASGEAKTKKEAFLKAGYSEESVRGGTHRISATDGFKTALAECGLTEKLVAESLADDIKAKPGDRVQELRLGAELLGMKQVGGNTTAIQINVNQDRERYG